VTNPHLAREIVRAGVALGEASVAAVLVHGRDQDPAFMLELVDRLALDGVAYLLPEADGRTWYPGRYLAPVADNEPSLSHALEAYRAALAAIAAAGIAPERTVLVGFSQGACLTAELVFREPAPYAGVAILTGALIGPPEEERPPPAALAGLPVFFGCAREDAWVALADARRAAQAFAAGGAATTFRDYDEPEHAIYDDEVDAVRDLLVAAGARLG
jgi:phospholipase/carboxylesterase